MNNNHWILEDYRERVRRKEAQKILIEHPTIIFHGRVMAIKVKHIGAGIYEVYKEKIK